jgi:RND family efflux transporter MFP subunit
MVAENARAGYDSVTVQMKPVEDIDLRPDYHSRRVPWWRRAIALILKILIPLAILAVAAKVSYGLYLSSPVADRKVRARVPRLVEVIEVTPATQGPMIEAWGEVVAARTLVMRPEIGGTVIALSDRLTPGGLVLAGEVLIRIDEREQRLAVAQAEAEMRQIEARIATENGQQERAKRDLVRLPGKLSESQRQLVLRVPQMAALQAELAASVAARELAMVALSHSVLRASFDALVIEEQVAQGTMLTAGSASATLVAADRFHVVVAVPVSALDWINPKAGQVLRFTQPGIWPEGSFREGTVERLTAGLSEAGRMAELIVTIDDPLARKPENRGKPRLLLGSFLRAIGEGRVVEDAVSLDRAYLRDHDTVWVMTPENRLEVRPVTVAWRGAEQVLISAGVAPGDRVITTPLAVMAPGMEVRLPKASDTVAGAAETGG